MLRVVVVCLYFIIPFIQAFHTMAEEFSEQALSTIKDEFKYKYFDNGKKRKHLTYIGVGLGGHKSIHNSKAVGIYLSGITPIGTSNFGIYGRGELIRDKNEGSTGSIWSWKAAIGLGYYLNQYATPFVSLAQCYPSEASCFNIVTPDGSTERDTDSIYLGLGSFIKENIFNNRIEISIDWSPYSNHNNRSIYIGYAFEFE